MMQTLYAYFKDAERGIEHGMKQSKVSIQMLRSEIHWASVKQGMSQT